MMNQGQEKFFLFILERVKEDKMEEAKALLHDSFKKQDEGTYTQEDLSSFKTEMTNLLKPEHVEEVQGIMKNFSDSLQQ